MKPITHMKEKISRPLQNFSSRVAQAWSVIKEKNVLAEKNASIENSDKILTVRLPKKLRRQLEDLLDTKMIDRLIDEKTLGLDQEVQCLAAKLKNREPVQICQFKIAELESIRDAVKQLIKESHYLAEKTDESSDNIEAIKQLMSWVYYFNNRRNQSLFDGQLTKDINQLKKKKANKENRYKYGHGPMISAAQKISHSNILEAHRQKKLANVKKLNEELEIKKMVEEIRDYIQFNQELPRLYFVERLDDFCRRQSLDPDILTTEIEKQYYDRNQLSKYDCLKLFQEHQIILAKLNSTLDKDAIKLALITKQAKLTNQEIGRRLYEKFDWVGRFKEIFPWENPE